MKSRILFHKKLLHSNNFRPGTTQGTFIIKPKKLDICISKFHFLKNKIDVDENSESKFVGNKFGNENDSLGDCESVLSENVKKVVSDNYSMLEIQSKSNFEEESSRLDFKQPINMEYSSYTYRSSLYIPKATGTCVSVHISLEYLLIYSE